MSFELGTIYKTDGVDAECLKILEDIHPNIEEFCAEKGLNIHPLIGLVLRDYINRYMAGDWGDLDDEDKATNDQAVKNNYRIVAKYKVTHAESTHSFDIYIITEWDRSVTTILLPEEY